MNEERKNQQAAAEPSLSEILQVRRDKLEALQDAGRDPFVQTRFERSAYSADIKNDFDAYDGKTLQAAGRISLGCTIKVQDQETGDEEIYAIVGSQEANPMECRISDDSPFGRALLGHTVGDLVEVEAPVGSLKYKILSIEK